MQEESRRENSSIIGKTIDSNSDKDSCEMGEMKQPSPTSSNSSCSSSSGTGVLDISNPTNPLSHLPSSSREMRNQAEKLRRDKLNTYISQLALIVPTVGLANKRLDKISILRLAANFLRIHLGHSVCNEMPFISSQSLNGFLLVVTGLGRIIYVSDGAEKLMGHSQVDLMGHSLYEIVHPEDQKLVAHHLRTENGSGYRSFYCRLSERTLSRSDPGRWVLMSVTGHYRPWNGHRKARPHHSDDGENCSSPSTGSDWMLVAILSPVRAPSIVEISLIQAIQDEYMTLHAKDGRIVNVDQRISVVAGYTVNEVLGKNAFSFISPEDQQVAYIAYSLMHNSSDGSGLVTYRLVTKSNQFIYMRSRGVMEPNPKTLEIEHFVCINTLLSEQEGEAEYLKQLQRLTPFVPVGAGRAAAVSNPTNPPPLPLGTPGGPSPSIMQSLSSYSYPPNVPVPWVPKPHLHAPKISEHFPLHAQMNGGEAGRMGSRWAMEEPRSCLYDPLSTSSDSLISYGSSSHLNYHNQHQPQQNHLSCHHHHHQDHHNPSDCSEEETEYSSGTSNSPSPGGGINNHWSCVHNGNSLINQNCAKTNLTRNSSSSADLKRRSQFIQEPHGLTKFPRLIESKAHSNSNSPFHLNPHYTSL
ncbi:unnamed protein product [Darwinula stevensoni]|uniref:Uncharacterized protein n=1 Tax=Darwinula stevensoni TaxID=69355 RepID=A0A7R8X536_9CRUS|nr:unnamed protein product [Darwinula stevensoni]CAG0880453.1 unnamed protein product [Darwinula stevensoni]